MKKLPIGRQDFASLIGDGNLYVDKTAHIFRLIQSGTYIFLSRPRRFGKSLLVSTLKEIFEGNRAVFRGLWIEDKITWERYPVIHVDFNQLRESADEALAQIREKGYPQHFRAAGKPLTLVGLAFDVEQKNVKAWKLSEA